MQEQPFDQKRADRLRDTLAALVASGYRLKGPEKLLNRYSALIRLYDTASTKDKKGCIFAVYGSPKMGKSTLFNSLMGENVLPVKPIPATGTVIDLIKDKRKSNYEVACQGEHTLINTFATPDDVCRFLNTYATQGSTFDSIKVTGAFPNAREFLTQRCILRDTPGAEARFNNEEEAGGSSNENLKADSEKAFASLKENCIPLFCVSAETIGQKEDVTLYDEYFRDLCCLHILTHIDKRTKDTQSAEAMAAGNEFRKKFSILPSADAPNPIVYTGISNKAGGQKFVDLGLDELEEEMKGFTSPETLEHKLRDIAVYLNEQKQEHGTPVFPADEIYYQRLSKVLESYLHE